MESAKDPYEVLGIAPGATLEQIRSKYRKLLRKFHPDIVAPDGDPEMLEYANRMTAEINAAWEILSGSQNRRGQHKEEEHGPPQLVVREIISKVEVVEGEDPILLFQIDNIGGKVPGGAELQFKGLSDWLKGNFDARVQWQRRSDDDPFPALVEVQIYTEGLPTGIWHDGEIELVIKEG